MKSNILDIQMTETGDEPVTTTEAKLQLIIDFTDDDTLIGNLITAARAAIENYCNISLITKTIVLTVDVRSRFELPYGPIQTEGLTVKVQKEVTANVPVYESAEGWNLTGVQFKTFYPAYFGAGDITVNSRYAYPDTDCGTPYKITYTAGYEEVPFDLKQAILAQVAWLYENRGDQEKQGLSPQAEGLALKYRHLWL